MRKADGKRKDVEFRKNVLKDFLENLKQAQERLFEDCDRLDSEHPDMSFEDKLRSLPKLQMEAPWGDAMDVILDGLERALACELDPFQLKGPWSGQVKLSDLDRFDIAVDAYRLWKKEGRSKETACAETAQKYSFDGASISDETVKLVLNSLVHLGELLLNDRFCDEQRELIDLIHRSEASATRTKF